jgi:excisionase family DNA binding protein
MARAEREATRIQSQILTGEAYMPQQKILEHRKPHRRGNGRLLTEDELATALGEEPRTIRHWRHSGRIPFYRIGYRSLRFNLNHVLEAIQKHEVQAIGSTSPLRKGVRREKIGGTNERVPS